MLRRASTASVTLVAKRLFPLGKKYDVEPWGLKWRSNTFFIIFTIGMGMFSDLFLYSLIVPVIPFLLQDRIGSSPDQLQSLTSTLLSTYALASMISSPIAGLLADKVAETRQGPFLVSLSALMMATVLLAVGQSYPVLVIARLLQGAASGCVWTLGLAMSLETVGPKNMGKVVGSIFSFLTAGTLFAPTLGGLLYEKTGYQGVFGVAVGVLVIDLALRILVVEKKVAKRFRDAGASSPESSSDADSTTADDDEETELIPKSPSIDYDIPTPESKIIKAVPILACLKSMSLIMACILGFAQAFFIATFDATVPIMAKDWYDFSPLRAGLLFLPLGVADLVFGPPAGWAVDRYGTKPAAVIGFGLLGAAYCLLRIPQPGGPEQIAVYSVLLSLCGIGLSIAGTPSIVEAGDIMEKYHKANPELFGEDGPYAQLYGMTSTMFSLGLTLGPIAAGSLKDSVGYANMNTVMGGFSFFIMLLSGYYIGRPVPWLTRLWKRREADHVEESE
ncbi:MFS general substrate transporter [Pseudovirgaria hyperparasitica]|uniref:MFS general substrate transporter n=1 Tax=Pseudovirgaria hyperparasitica TaxID=470096 RepID=A0A6A6VWL7_9PEZI|nr:MFS general substrate transporter [Pseudovirgaria hyperparasitica]KAF2754613.1 MFS general substrate transporter [Pseudovirgaria hyperparasitica]